MPVGFRGLFKLAMGMDGGNVVPVLQSITNASTELLGVSSRLAPALGNVGTTMNTLASASSKLSQFKAVEGALKGTTAQASFLQSTLLDTASSVRQLGTELTGLTAATVDTSQKMNQVLGLGLNLNAENVALAKSFFSVGESIRSVGATGQITSARLGSLSQTLELFAQNTGRLAKVELQQLSSRLVQASAQMKSAEVQARQLSTANLNLSDSQRLANAETVKISDALTRFSITGGASSSVMLRMANQLNTLSSSVDPRFSSALKTASSELVNFSSQLNLAEQEARKAGASKGGFQMLTDVSDAAATRMRKISAAAQGAMLSMSLLQGNVTGLAFSLIFLQFSGFLKLSLAAAGAMTIIAGLGLGFRALVKEGTRLRELNDKFFILTGSLEAGGLAMDAARKIAEKYGLTIGPLAEIQLAALVEEAGLTNKEFDTLGGLLLLSDEGLIKNAGSTDELTKKFIDLLVEDKNIEEVLREFGLTTDTLKEKVDRFNRTDLGKLRMETARVKRAFGEMIGDPAQMISVWWERFKIGWIKFFIGWFEVFKGDWKQGLKDIFGIGTREALGDGEEDNKTFFEAWWKSVSEDVFVSSSVALFKLITNFFSEEFPKPFKAGFNKVKGLWNFFTEGIKDESAQFMSGWNDSIAEGYQVQRDTFVVHVGKFFRSITDSFLNIVITAKIFAFDFVKSIKDKLVDLFQVGKDAVKGLWAGFMSFDIVQKAVSLARRLIQAFKDALGIGSPSKEFMKMGKLSMEGFNAGISGTSGRGKTSNNVSINIQVHGQFSNDPRAASESVASQVLKGITRSGSFSGAPLVV